MAAASARGVALDDPDALFAPLDAQRATPLPAERGASLTRAGLLAAGCAESAADIRTLDLTAFAPSVRWASWLAECRGLRALKAHFPQDAAQVVSEIEQQCDLRDLRAFRAAGSGLRTLRTLPFPALETLELRHCMFRALPDLRALRKLSQLALVGCDLRQIPEGALPLSLARLDVSSNRLESLAFAAGLPSLKTLAAGENCLAKLPSSLGALTQLRDLDLADNKLCDAADLTPLAALPALTVLDLSGNGLTSCVGFPAIAALEELSLAGNRLASPEGLARACPQLESLDLDGNPISALAPLAREVAMLAKLDVLHVAIDSLNCSEAELWSALPETLSLLNGRARPAAGKAARPSSAALGLGGPAALLRREALRQADASVLEAQQSYARHADAVRGILAACRGSGGAPSRSAGLVPRPPTRQRKADSPRSPRPRSALRSAVEQRPQSPPQPPPQPQQPSPSERAPIAAATVAAATEALSASLRARALQAPAPVRAGPKPVAGAPGALKLPAIAR